jgi:gluconokinase
MRSGIPLTDADRLPWLRLLADIIDQRVRCGQRLVLACSALKQAYRDVLSQGHPNAIAFVRRALLVGVYH